MKITFEETTSRKEWIHVELLRSLTPEIISDARENGCYEVKLMVNDNLLEPKFLNDLIDNIAEYIDKEANKIANDKLSDALDKARKLESIVQEAADNIRSEFNISEDIDD